MSIEIQVPKNPPIAAPEAAPTVTASVPLSPNANNPPKMVPIKMLKKIPGRLLSLPLRQEGHPLLARQEAIHLP